MAELIDKGAFIEDIKTEIVNLAMNGLKGTPRDRSYLYEMVDRINEQPTTTEADIRAKAIEEFAEKLGEAFSEHSSEIEVEGMKFDILTLDSVIEIMWDLVEEQLKGE